MIQEFFEDSLATWYRLVDSLGIDPSLCNLQRYMEFTCRFSLIC